MKHLSLRLKLFLLISIILIPLTIFQIYNIRRELNQQINNEIESNIELAQAISHSLVNYMEEVWIQEGVIGTSITSNPNLKNEEISNYLKQVLKSEYTIKRLSWISPSGVIISDTSDDFVGVSLVRRDYVQRILKGEEKVVSYLINSYLTNEPVVPIARGIKVDGKLAGIMVAIVDINRLGLRFADLSFRKGDVFSFIDSRGTVIYRNDEVEIHKKAIRLPKDSPAMRALFVGEVIRTPKLNSKIDGSIRMAVDYPIKRIGWVCSVSSRYDIVLGKYYDKAFDTFLMLILITFVSVVAASFLSYRILRSISSLKSAADAMVNGDYSVRTNIHGYDEIAVTAQAFNRMAEGIENYDKLKTQFFSNLSHELKTPVNVIFASAQLLASLRDNGDVKEYRSKVNKCMNSIRQNCYRLTKLITNLIDITRYDSGFLNLKLGNYNIVSIVEDITQSIVRYAETKGITVIFDTEIEEKITALDPNMIERIMLNLISNAIKFTNEGGSIFVNVCDRDKSAIITVEDTGIGIPQDKLEIIFERFRQVDTSLSRNNEGSGIGLSLVKALVEAHGGYLIVESKLGKGTKFTINLPIKVLEDYELCDDRIKADKCHNIVEKINIEFSDIYSIKIND